MNTQPSDFYQNKIKEISFQLEQINKKLSLLTILRLASFLVFIGSFVLLTIIETPIVALAVTITGIATFIFFVKASNKKQAEKAILEQLLQINQNELKYLQFDFTEFENAGELCDTLHPYASDLNIFGHASLFQYLNRCATLFGKKKLSQNLLNPDCNWESIQKKQASITELSSKTQWRQEFQAKGKLTDTKEDQLNELLNWVQEPSVFIYKKGLKKAITILPIISIGLLIYGYFSGIYFFASISFTIQLLIIGKYNKQIKAIHERLSNRFEQIECFSNLFHLIENENFTAKHLIELKSNIENKKDGSAVQVKKLANILELFDRRLNILAAVVLNALYMADIRNLIQLEQWKESNREALPHWLEILGEFDALNSFAAFAYNNPNYGYPKSSEAIIIKANELGHPLIPSTARICNDFEIHNTSQFVILTGANMAGKSTFLRTVGINMILAMCGAPVCAKQFEFKPLPIFTSISVKDSLFDNESYFYAELKRLRMIIDELEAGHSIFIILDEILKGTNSADKLKGSRSLMQKLIKYKAAGIVATHDIALGELENNFPENIINHAFEVQLDDDRLYYDYKLHRGVCKNLNASFLMKKMGIIE